ncbi:DJ-1/PfpI family protein [uncultured Draconibacterium sp.]|uniref:DJ-1/PfpI family protein n=1 Tax=uncultured Draconibacterium sp. TaxID=1573823 RepID=UPI0029C6ED3E|nr:DJ-1/PfpI family protein [uncultured Draconibacterium sp.]
MKYFYFTVIFLLNLNLNSIAQNPKLLMVVPPDKFHDSEFSDPMLALDSAQIDVIISSLKVGNIGGVMGDTIQATCLLNEVKVDEFDGICIMGGKGTGQYLWNNELVNELINEFEKREKLVTAICAGAVSLARAGALKGVPATTYPVKGFVRQLEENGAIYSPDSVVVDGNIITANGPSGAHSFGRVLVSKLNNAKLAGYLFAHMTKEDYGHLYYSISEDGLNWTLLNEGKRINEAYRGHPDICKGHDGRYYQIGVEENTGRPILWSSDDLLEWKEEMDLPCDVFEKNLGHKANASWYGAPKMYYDEATSKYIITWHCPKEGIAREDASNYWCSMRTFFVTTSDLKSFSSAKRLFDFEMGTIDVIIRKEGELYYAIIKDECEANEFWPTGKSVRICVSEKLEGPYSYPGDKVSPSYREAPTVIHKKDGGWLMYFEQYPGVQYEAVQAPSLMGPWYDVYTMKIKIPDECRHGCMIPLTANQYNAILKKYGSN